VWSPDEMLGCVHGRKGYEETPTSKCVGVVRVESHQVTQAQFASYFLAAILARIFPAPSLNACSGVPCLVKINW
jgi:hypothetical protein